MIELDSQFVLHKRLNGGYYGGREGMKDDVCAGVGYRYGGVGSISGYGAGLKDGFSVDFEGWTVPCRQIGEFVVPCG